MMEIISLGLAWFVTPDGRHTAAVALFVVMQLVKMLADEGSWLMTDSTKYERLTSKRKKFLVTTLLAMAPVVPLLLSDEPMGVVMTAAGQIIAEAMGLKMLYNVVRPQPAALQGESK